MLFVEENNFNRQISLLSFIATTGDYNICAWLYPKSLATKIAGFIVTDNLSNLIPVTTYEDGCKPKCTKLVSASEYNFGFFSEAKAELINDCDSLALYKRNELTWVASAIGHEGMCIVQDSNLLNILIHEGYNVLSEAPNWW